jgi:nitrate/nitrite transporter NarK
MWFVARRRWFWAAAVAVVLAVAVFGLTRDALSALVAVAAPMAIHALIRVRADPWRETVSPREEADLPSLRRSPPSAA